MLIPFVTLKLILIHQFQARNLLDGGRKRTDRAANFENQETFRCQARRVHAQRKRVVSTREDFCQARELRSDCGRLTVPWERRR